MKIFYDCEFLEDGTTIEPISWGGVRDDGAELYVIMAAAETVTRALHNPWLRENVIRHLPIRRTRMDDVTAWQPNEADPDYRHWTTLQGAASKIAEFVLGAPEPELWAWYGAYDHVMTAQLFGTMMDLPEGFPMFTNDLKQLVDHKARRVPRIANIPSMPGRTEHNALHDAREVRWRYWWLYDQLGVKVPDGILSEAVDL